MDGDAPAKNTVAEIAQQLRKTLSAIKQRPSEIDNTVADVKKRQAKIRRHVEDTNARIRRGIRPDGKKFRL